MAKKERKPPQRPLSGEVSSGWEILKKFTERTIAIQRTWAEMRFSIYRNLFPWFGPSMAKAGWPINSEATAAVVVRAGQEWQDLTGLPPLCDEESWSAAGHAAKIPPTDWEAVTIDQFVLTLTGWAKSVAAEARRKQQNGANSANNPRLFPKGPLDDLEIIELVCRLDAAKGGKLSQNEIARQFAKEKDGNDKRAPSLLATVRRMRLHGKVNL